MVVGLRGAVEKVADAVLAAEAVEEHLARPFAEAGGKDLAVVGEDLLGDAVRPMAVTQRLTDRAGGGSGYEHRRDAEAGVIVDCR